MGLLVVKSRRARKCEFASSKVWSRSSKLGLVLRWSVEVRYLSKYLSLGRYRLGRPEPPGPDIVGALLDPSDLSGGNDGVPLDAKAGYCGAVSVFLSCGSLENRRWRSRVGSEDIVVPDGVAVLSSGDRPVLLWWKRRSMTRSSSPDGLTWASGGRSSRIDRTIWLALRYRSSAA